ncbi:isopeptide-forming domain-containing fimbrial protein [Bifidobacterium moukalabense]|uniref:isopeptide-forming domain-containing fimbrial protein n=1 Tax=Bifidobacterium moukalabense TaxID=1333651 RepID=UPI001485BD70|nr:isopeptide-forming domain-containing fimbrial protein [Bifidobacterium moukalabense]
MTIKPAKAVMASIAAMVALATAAAGIASADETSIPAADLAKAQPITVKADSDISGKTLVAIKLAAYSAAQTDGTNITGYDVQDAGLAAAVDDALTKAGINRTASGDDTTAYEAANPMAWVVTHLLDSATSPWAGQLRNFLDQLKNEQAVKNAEGTTLTGGDDTTVMSADVEPGVYVILDRTTNGQASIAMMNGTGINGMTTLKSTADNAETHTLGQVEYKVHDVTAPVKKIVEGDQLKDTNETAIGKTVDYKVTTTVPNWTGYDHYYLALNDTMSQGLTFNNDVTATVAGETVTVKTVNNNGTISILFAPTSDGSSDIIADKANYPIDKDIVVTYSATVNKNAVIGGDGNPNSIELEYSHNPNDVTDHDTTPGNTVKTYVGAFKLVKQDAKGASLEGAEFNVFETGSTTPLKFVKDGDTYRLADKTETTGTTTTVTAGTASITGVDGKYDVVETKSPFGNAIKAKFTTTVSVDQKTGAYTAALTKSDANNLVASDNKFTFTVTNCRNIIEMPKTGATWLAIYVAAGLLVIAAGAAMYLRRMHAEA